eukprot:5341126-Karenia_brevis.AAC.1
MEPWYAILGADVDREFNASIVENNLSIHHCCDRDITLCPNSGVPPGLVNATKIFNYVYHE